MRDRIPFMPYTLSVGYLCFAKNAPSKDKEVNENFASSKQNLVSRVLMEEQIEKCWTASVLEGRFLPFLEEELLCAVVVSG